MSRTGKRTVTVFAWTENGKFIGEWPSISKAAFVNNTTASSISNALYVYKDHFSVGKFWMTEKCDIKPMLKLHKELVESKKTGQVKQREIQQSSKIYFERAERVGNYVFIKSELPGNECCGRCALYYAKKCLPCRKDENHEHGYWRYSKQFDVNQ